MKLLTILLTLPLFLFGFKLCTLPDTVSYEAVKNRVAAQRKQVAHQFYSKEISIDSLNSTFEQLLINQLIPYWYGTPWTFEGHTDHPDSSSVACGYFVSTTLKHIGINVNRYKMAQQASLNILKTVAMNENKITFYPRTATLETQLHTDLEDGIYLVGLDYHVGYLLKNGEEIYFIHSTYLSPTMVVIEEIEHSKAFYYSNEYFITSLSRNEVFLLKWISGAELTIVTE